MDWSSVGGIGNGVEEFVCKGLLSSWSVVSFEGEHILIGGAFIKVGVAVLTERRSSPAGLIRGNNADHGRLGLVPNWPGLMNVSVGHSEVGGVPMILNISSS